MSRKRPIQVTPETREAFESQRHAFKKKFGREMGPKDPFFFDPDENTPKHLTKEKAGKIWDEVAKMMLEAVPHRPELAYATKKTGRIVSEMNMKLLSPQEIDEWNAAVQEYRDLAKKGQAPEI